VTGFRKRQSIRENPLDVRNLKENEHKLWDRFVMQHPGTSFFFLSGVKSLIAERYGYRPRYLVAWNGSRIEGILPLFDIRQFGFGRRLISIPHSVYGGICANSEDAAAALQDHAINLADELHVRYLELRQQEQRSGPWMTRSMYCTFHLHLQAGEEQIWKNMRKSLRRSIIKAQKNGLSVDFDSRDIRAFYHFYRQDQKRFGTPVQEYGWYHDLFCRFPENHLIARVLFQKQVIAQFLVRRFKGRISETVGNDVQSLRHLNPNSFLEWELIRYACANRFSIYDFGRSIRYSGTYHFKQGWGGEEVGLHYLYFSHHPKKVMDASQCNPKREWFARGWRILPMAVVRFAGPAIRRRYP